jgi:hypothetical protein
MYIPNDDTGAALRRFVNNGWDLAKPMEIDFFVAVPSEQDGYQVSVKARELGFQTSVEQDDETLKWTCYCTKVLVPTYEAIVEIENQLNFISTPYGGYSDGFGSYGNTD